MFSIKDFFSKYDKIHSFQQIWSNLLKKSLMGNFIFCAADKVKLLFEKGEQGLNAYKWRQSK